MSSDPPVNDQRYEGEREYYCSNQLSPAKDPKEDITPRVSPEEFEPKASDTVQEDIKPENLSLESPAAAYKH